MSVLIKGVKIPRSCDECYIREKGTCPLLKVNVGEWGRIVGCPLIELPDHGDLIDRDALPKYTGYALSANDVANAVINAPVVIPAERSEYNYVDMFRLCNKAAVDIAERRETMKED